MPRNLPLLLAFLTGLCAFPSGDVVAADAAKFHWYTALVLSSAKTSVLYSLEPAYRRPKDRAEKLGGVTVLGKTTLDEKATAKAIQEFQSAIIPPLGGGMGCFDPRHGLRIEVDGHRYDLILCYECAQLYVYRDGKGFDGYNVGGSPKNLNAMLTAAKIPLAYELPVTPEEKALRAALEKKMMKEYLQRINLWKEEYIPKPLRSVWNEHHMFNALNNSDKSGIPPLKAALEKAVPGREERIRTLLSWIGNGSVIGAQKAPFEDVPAILLLDYTTEEIGALLQSAPLPQGRLLDGAAAFFAGDTFSEARPHDLKEKVPPALKKVILEYLLKSPDEATQQWAGENFAD